MNTVFMGFTLNEIIAIREIFNGRIHRQVDDHEGLHITSNGTGDYTEVSVGCGKRIFIDNKKLSAAGINFCDEFFYKSIKELFIRLAIEASNITSSLEWLIEQEDYTPLYVSVSRESYGFTITEEKNGEYLFCNTFHGYKMGIPFLPELGEQMSKTISVKWLEDLGIVIDDTREIDMDAIVELHETLRLF